MGDGLEVKRVTDEKILTHHPLSIHLNRIFHHLKNRIKRVMDDPSPIFILTSH